MQIVTFFMLFAIGATMAVPEGIFKIIPVLERTETREQSGEFTLRYVSGDGTVFSERGYLKANPDGKGSALIKEGEYSYNAPNGQVIRTKYVSDFDGFRAIGDHLPVSVVA